MGWGTVPRHFGTVSSEAIPRWENPIFEPALYYNYPLFTKLVHLLGARLFWEDSRVDTIIFPRRTMRHPTSDRKGLDASDAIPKPTSSRAPGRASTWAGRVTRLAPTTFGCRTQVKRCARRKFILTKASCPGGPRAISAWATRCQRRRLPQPRRTRLTNRRHQRQRPAPCHHQCQPPRRTIGPRGTPRRPRSFLDSFWLRTRATG